MLIDTTIFLSYLLCPFFIAICGLLSICMVGLLHYLQSKANWEQVFIVFCRQCADADANMNFNFYDIMYHAPCVHESGCHDPVCTKLCLIMWSFKSFLVLDHKKFHDCICICICIMIPSAWTILQLRAWLLQMASWTLQFQPIWKGWVCLHKIVSATVPWGISRFLQMHTGLWFLSEVNDCLT